MWKLQHTRQLLEKHTQLLVYVWIYLWSWWHSCWMGWLVSTLIDGSSAQMPEWCMSYMSCGGYSSLWLGGSHPQLEDGVVTHDIFGSRDSQCSRYRSDPIQVKAVLEIITSTNLQDQLFRSQLLYIVQVLYIYSSLRISDMLIINLLSYYLYYYLN